MEFSLSLTATGGDGGYKESGKMGRIRKRIELKNFNLNNDKLELFDLLLFCFSGNWKTIILGNFLKIVFLYGLVVVNVANDLVVSGFLNDVLSDHTNFNQEGAVCTKYNNV